MEKNWIRIEKFLEKFQGSRLIGFERISPIWFVGIVQIEVYQGNGILCLGRRALRSGLLTSFREEW